jgi:UDP-2,3-diacylglucosamine hydrolase
MIVPIKHLPAGKKIYFASDFHLGAPSYEQSRSREEKIVRWLDMIKKDAAAIYLLGDIFDFWFEYRHVVPKGYIRLQGKLAELTDGGIPVIFFTGNHDMWMFDYFTREFSIPIYRDPQLLEVGTKRLLIGHGDGLGPGDHTYKLIKKVFANKMCQWLFARVHPNLGIGIANSWSQRSRISNTKKDEAFLGDDEWLLTYCREIEARKHHDFYIFGHRHLPLDLKINEQSRYVNLGEWVSYCTYAVFDGENVELKEFEES